MTRHDPMEKIISKALDEAGVRYTDQTRNAGRPSLPSDINLDFHLVDIDVYIEVKQFHSDRTTKQLTSAKNVILAQGRGAVEALAMLIRTGTLS